MMHTHDSGIQLRINKHSLMWPSVVSDELHSVCYKCFEADILTGNVLQAVRWDQSIDSSSAICCSFLISWSTFTETAAAVNSSLGIVFCFSGETLDLLIMDDNELPLFSFVMNPSDLHQSRVKMCRCDCSRHPMWNHKVLWDQKATFLTLETVHQGYSHRRRLPCHIQQHFLGKNDRWQKN